MSSDLSPGVDQPSKLAANKRESVTFVPRFRLSPGEYFIARGVSPDRYFTATENDAGRGGRCGGVGASGDAARQPGA